MTASALDTGPADALVTFLPSSDLVASRDFYERILGLALVVDQTTCLIFKVTDAAFIGVCDSLDASGDNPVITTVVTDDVDGWCARILDAGWTPESGPEHSEMYGIYHAFLRDPSGNRIEIQRFDDPSWSAPQRGT
jgi:catechol 2,3-dioxygenase-like lactoylglutathione lyase family enzyme